MALKDHSVFGEGFAVAVAILDIFYIGFTRNLTDWRYLTDVLEGYALEIAMLGVIYTLLNPISKKKVRMLIIDKSIHIKFRPTWVWGSLPKQRIN